MSEKCPRRKFFLTFYVFLHIIQWSFDKTEGNFFMLRFDDCVIVTNDYIIVYEGIMSDIMDKGLTKWYQHFIYGHLLWFQGFVGLDIYV